LALSGSDAVFDLGNALAIASYGGNPYLTGSYWPRQIEIIVPTGIAAAVALEYVNVGLVSPTSSYDGIPSGSNLTSATESGAYLLPATTDFPFLIYPQAYSIQMKTNLKVHVYGASGTALLNFMR